MRRLTLHSSALNDDEYELYTTSLSELAWADDAQEAHAHDDAYYEQLRIGVREARGWLRGRYAHLPAGAIDVILRFFSPGLGQADVLTGSEFFAALRLVVHVESGKKVDRALAFVQAHPASRQQDPPQKTQTFEVPPASPNPFTASQLKSPQHNPFVAHDAHSRRPQLPPRKLTTPIFTPPPKHGSILLPPPSRRSASPTRSISSTPALLPSTSTHPPVPPPKPAHVTSVLMRQSLQASKAAQTMKRAEEQLEAARVLQVLKSSSARAPAVREDRSRSPGPGVDANAQQGPGEEERERERGREKEGVKPPLPRRRHTQQQQPSPPVSVSSLEQVALAHPPRLKSPPPPPPPPPPTRNPFPTTAADKDNNPYHRTPQTSPSPSLHPADLPLPTTRPPTHPDRKPPPPPPPSSHSSPFANPPPSSPNEEASPTSRIFRSKSLHHPSPPPIPPFLPAGLVPPRRKRPESVQVLGSSSLSVPGSVFSDPDASEGGGGGAAALGRHVSFSSSSCSSTHSNGTPPHRRQASLSVASDASSGSGAGSVGAELSRLAKAWQPRLEKARYKAEAGLSRRGYVREWERGRGRESGEERGGTEELLVGRGARYGEREEYEPPSVDVDEGERERDEMKWPVGEGEGWRPL